MKKNTALILLLTLLLSSLAASSQLRYGFRLGGSIAKASLSSAPGISIKNGSGFSGGLLLEYQMENCGFAPDISVIYTRYSSR
ncbi:MAG: hypothetical protein K2L11_09155, partial [Muribaculaceae bacterium]|nr:hypothetical protein [Muribaculaceae bacterium]